MDEFFSDIVTETSSNVSNVPEMTHSCLTETLDISIHVKCLVHDDTQVPRFAEEAAICDEPTVRLLTVTPARSQGAQMRGIQSCHHLGVACL